MAHKVLVAVDGSSASERALEYASRLGRDIRGFHLTILHIGEPDPDFGVPPRAARAEKEEVEGGISSRPATELFRFLAFRAEQLGLDAQQIDCKFIPEVEHVSAGIIAEAQRGGYEAICVGRHGISSVKEFFIGSVAERVIRHARRCTVWVVD